MNATRVSGAGRAILAAMKARQTADGIAAALDTAGWLQTPGEVRGLTARITELERTAPAEKDTQDGGQPSVGESTPLLAYLARYEEEPAPLGWYSNPQAARAHCEAELSAEHPAGTALLWDWVVDEEDGVAELVSRVGKAEDTTGYCVVTVELQAAYDPEAEW